MQFDVVTEAALGPRDLAPLLNVHRVTVSQWLNKRKSPHHLLTAKVQKVLDAIERGSQAGDFPVPPSVRRCDRDTYIRAKVIEHLKTARAATSTLAQ